MVDPRYHRHPLVHAAAAGGLGAAFLLCWEHVFAWLTTRVNSSFPGPHWVPYLGIALLVSFVLGLVNLRRAPREALLARASRVYACLLTLLIFTRIAEVLRGPLGPMKSTLCGLAVAAVYLLAVLLVGRTFFLQEAWLPLQAIATSALLVFYLNSKALGEPLSPTALTADLAVALAALLLIWAGRRWGARPAAFLAISILLAFTLTAWVGARQIKPPQGTAASRKGQSLIIVVVDTLRYDTFQATLEHSSEGRRFAEALGPSVWYDSAQAASPWTVPSMGTVMTGLYPQEHAFGAAIGPQGGHAKLSKEVQTLAELLHRRGYSTGAVVGNPYLVHSSGFARGFQRYDSVEGGNSRYLFLGGLTALGLFPDEPYLPAPLMLAHADALRQELQNLGKFFLYIHLMDPHSPYRSHPELEPPSSIPSLERFDPLYVQEVRFVLDAIARFVRNLDEQGALDDAWLVFLSDHGEMFPTDGHPVTYLPGGEEDSGHGHALYQELLHIPLILVPPRSFSKSVETTRVSLPVGHVDLLPTLSDVLHLDLSNRQIRGQSLAGFIPGSQWDPAQLSGRSLFATGVIEDPDTHALISEGKKLIHYRHGRVSDEVYDLRVDPGESNNLVDRTPNHRVLLEELTSKLEGMRLPKQIEASNEAGERARRLRALGYAH